MTLVMSIDFMSSITKESFLEKFKDGHDKEKEVIHIFSVEPGWSAHLDDARSSHDISVSFDGRTEKVEIKNEDNYANSGNVIVEYYQGEHKPSGILASKAYVFIHSLGTMAFLYKVEEMKVWLERMDKLFPIIALAKSDNNNMGRKVAIRSVLESQHKWNDFIAFKKIPHSHVWGKNIPILKAENKSSSLWTDEELASIAKKYRIKHGPLIWEDA